MNKTIIENRLKAFFLTLGIVLIITPGWAQSEENNLSVAAQVRPRAEYRNGSFYPRGEGIDPAMFINYRSRLSMEYKRSNLSLAFSAQQVGVWGQDPAVDQNGRFMLNEAWASLTSKGGFFIKLGRQALNYDDERILSGIDWNTSGRFHDALKLGFENTNNKIDLILAFNQNRDLINGGTYYYIGGQPYKTMQTLWFQHIYNKPFNISFLLMNLGLEAGEPSKSKVKFSQTMGTNVSFLPGALQLKGTFYYQTGKTITNQSIYAFMWALNASYAINPHWRVMAASDYLSGDDGKDVSKSNSFDPLYGAHHKFYGNMDYFYASSFLNNIKLGLWDNQLGITYKATTKVSLSLNVHHFQITSDLTSFQDRYNEDLQKMKRSLGTEMDLQFTWNIMKDVTCTGGYSTFFGNDTMKLVKGGDPSKWQDWIWFSININPKILVAKW